jgi:hypothetical protein
VKMIDEVLQVSYKFWEHYRQLSFVAASTILINDVIAVGDAKTKNTMFGWLLYADVKVSW